MSNEKPKRIKKPSAKKRRADEEAGDDGDDYQGGGNHDAAGGNPSGLGSAATMSNPTGIPALATGAGHDQPPGSAASSSSNTGTTHASPPSSPSPLTGGSGHGAPTLQQQQDALQRAALFLGGCANTAPTDPTARTSTARTLTNADLGQMVKLLQAGINSTFADQTNRLSEQVNAMIFQAKQETGQRDAKLIEKPVHRRYFQGGKIIMAILESKAYKSEQERLADAIAMATALATLAMDMGGPTPLPAEEAEQKFIQAAKRLRIAGDVAAYCEPIRAHTSKSTANPYGSHSKGLCRICYSPQHWAKDCPQRSTAPGVNTNNIAAPQSNVTTPTLAWAGVPGYTVPSIGQQPHMQYAIPAPQPQNPTGYITVTPAVPPPYIPTSARTHASCTHCHKRGHTAEHCWTLNPNLRPQRTTN